MLTFFSTFLAFQAIFSARIPCEDNDDFSATRVYRLTPRCRARPDTTPVPPNCVQPLNLADDQWVSDTFSVTGYLYVNENDNTARVQLYGNGFPNRGPVSAFFLTQNGGIRDPATTHPIYFPDNNIGASAAPIAPVTASFNGGIDPSDEPNVFLRDGSQGYFDIILDYNPLLPFQTPITNRRSFITQEGIPCQVGGENGFPVVDNLCQNEYKEREGRFAPIARAYLREFNADGSVKVDANGRQQIVRGPQPASWVMILGNADGTTFGVSPSLPSPSDVNGGNTFEITAFSLDPSVLVEIDEDDVPENLEDVFDDFCDD